ncbi:MAG: hydrogenase maturation nickel metallochaperone HypA [Pirellulales bacterium]|nr:hydrogenase maturation nickel metallochaperone HypA [Pirellulales bacterium]
MHELSIVEALIEQVQEEVRRAGVEGKIAKLELSIGRLSGVNADSIRFAFDLLSSDTILAESEIVIHESKAVCRCNSCRSETEIDDLLSQCPRCASDDIAIDGGRELLLQSIDVEE